MSEITLEKYNVKIALMKEMLGTNPNGLDVMDKHIIDRQRKLIAENSSVNKAINKYLDAKTISEERGQIELKSLRIRVEELLGRELSTEEFETLKDGDLKAFKDLKETMGELEEKGITCFFRNPEGQKEGERAPICIGNHMILGFMKAAAESICRTKATKKGTVLQSAGYTQSIINQHVNIFPEFLNSSKDIKRHEDGSINYLQRSLRAMTAQGKRISLAKSEVLPGDSTFDFTIETLSNSPLKEEHIKEILSYGQLKGLGQWRNAGYGRFTVVEFSKA